MVAPTLEINTKLTSLHPQWSSDYALVPERAYQPNDETRFSYSLQTEFAASQNQISLATKILPLQQQSSTMPLRQPSSCKHPFHHLKRFRHVGIHSNEMPSACQYIETWIYHVAIDDTNDKHTSSAYIPLYALTSIFRFCVCMYISIYLRVILHVYIHIYIFTCGFNVTTRISINIHVTQCSPTMLHKTKGKPPPQHPPANARFRVPKHQTNKKKENHMGYDGHRR